MGQAIFVQGWHQMDGREVNLEQFFPAVNVWHRHFDQPVESPRAQKRFVQDISSVCGCQEKHSVSLAKSF